ncbi:MAG: ABC transporter ATP-binding protein [Planctomycetaceae bacterium]|nr:MAG: ABC transporter ATP-binding protein [Planctomycetaceae bacterium]
MNDPGTVAIEACGLTKRFADVLAVDRVDFDVREGEVFGFLGPNGAGKTTTINMLTGLARPTAGTIRYFGRDVTQNRKKAQHLMGVVPDESNLYPELTGHENLCFCASLYGMRKREREDRARRLLDLFDLADAAGRKFAVYSKGMKRKLVIAAGIIHNPPILFLDEPTTGIDVPSARQIRQMLADLKSQGTTIFLTTHYIEEAERLCERIAFIVDGKLVKLDTLNNLVRDIQNQHVVEFTLSGCDTDLTGPLQNAFSDGTFERISDTVLRMRTDQPVHLAPLVRFLEDRSVDVTEARIIRPSLEDVFVAVTGIELERMRSEKDKGGRGR